MIDPKHDAPFTLISGTEDGPDCRLGHARTLDDKTDNQKRKLMMEVLQLVGEKFRRRLPFHVPYQKRKGTAQCLVIVME